MPGSKKQPKRFIKKVASKPDEPLKLLMLTHGVSTNYPKWAEAMRAEIGISYGNLVSIFDSDELLEPADVDTDYVEDDDPHGFIKCRIKTKIAEREKEIALNERMEPKVAALMWKHMTPESREAVQRHVDYDHDEDRNNPLLMLRSIRATHQVGGGAADAASRRAQSRQTYRTTRQGPMESIAEYKVRFTFNKQAYDDAGNVEIPAGDVAMDFMNGLDNGRYARFAADLQNDRAKGIAFPGTLNEMFQRASTFVVVKSNPKFGGGAVFTTTADESNHHYNNSGARGTHGRGRGGRGRGGRGQGGRGGGRGKAEHDAKANGGEQRPKKTIICYNCDEEGHIASHCPNRGEEVDEQHSSAYVTTSLGAKDPETPEAHSFATQRKFLKTEALLDDCSDVTIAWKGLLTGLREELSYVGGFGGSEGIKYAGNLAGFGEVRGADNPPVNVLCQHDVEQLYEVTIDQGVSKTVHMDGYDLVFHKREDKFYVADMSDWVVQQQTAMVTTVAENESKYSLKEVKRAREALEMIKNAGFTSEKTALGLVNDGNLTGVQITAHDVRRAFDINGKLVPTVRGCRTAHKAHTQKVDEALRAPRGELQTLYGDVVYFHSHKKPHVMVLSKPLDVMLSVPVENTKTAALGRAVHSIVGTLQGKGFNPVTLYLDPQPGFQGLEGQIQGVDVDISGAGDHMNVLDVEIRHVKEIYRSVISSLPWTLPEWLDKDLVAYCVSRKNLRSRPGSAVSPRVKMTGRKPVFKKELSIGFGDRCECYDPAGTSNDATKARTVAGIALRPTGNANGSWWFLCLATKRRIRRTNWVKMVTCDLTISHMNEYSKSTEDAEEEPDEEETSGEKQPDEVQAGEEQQVEQVTPDIDVPALVEQPEVEAEQLQEEEQREIDEEEDSSEPDAADEVQPQSPRRSARVKGGTRKPVRYRAFHTSVRRGLKEHGAEAYRAIVAELKQLLVDKKALVPVQRGDLSARQLKKSIRSLMFLKPKYDGLGRFEKIKARLVANGKQQDRTLYPDTYSPTVALQSVMMCLTMAAAESRKVCAVDIGGAYLNADRDSADGEEIIMELEPMLVSILAKVAPDIKPYVDEKGRVLVKLSKAMYGTLDAARIWYDKITGVLRGMGFEPNEVDPCVLNKMINGKQCTILLYVDDLLITCVDESAMREVIKQLEDAFEGDVKHSFDKDLSYLGMHIKVEEGRITVSMTAYLQSLLDELGVTGSVTTPATSKLFMINPTSRALGPQAAKQFHTVVAKLLYLAKRVRIDILLTIAFLCTRVKAPTESDQAKLDRLLKYLNGSKESVLVLEPKGELVVEGYIDASFACHPDGKSHTGLLVTLGGCTVLCMSSKQKLVTRDSTEAELVGLSDKVMGVMQCYDFVRAQGVKIAAPEVYQDNMSTISLVTKGGGQYRTKYLKVRQAFVQERAAAGDVNITYMPTGRMLADTLTKALQGAVFRHLTRRITGQ